MIEDIRLNVEQVWKLFQSRVQELVMMLSRVVRDVSRQDEGEREGRGCMSTRQ